MRKFRFIASLLLVLCASMSSTVMAQGYGMYVDGNFISLQEGDSVLFTGAEPQSAHIVVMRDGQIRSTSPGGQITFYGDVETYFQKVPASFLEIWSDSYHYAFGYPAEMIVRDILTSDSHYSQPSGYNWFSSWEKNTSQGISYASPHFLWGAYQDQIAAANKLIGAINPQTATDVQKGYLGVGLAYRALCYLDIARMYEFLPNDATFGKTIFGDDLTHLTVPIVTEKTTAEQAANNPRATRQEMARFIESDLDAAQQYIVFHQGNTTTPNLAAVYGLKARLYMWTEDYAKAEAYARMAINASPVKPITEKDALDTQTGYNQAWQFLWAAQQYETSRSVTSGILNWTSWTSNQTVSGYTGGADLYYTIDRQMYDRIGNSDWRKKQWVAPAGSELRAQNIFINQEQESYLQDYASLKFRPGKGNTEDYMVAMVTAVPLMRVEEMYFIEAEAAAHQDAKYGQLLLTNFMKQHRDPFYTCTLTGDTLIDEIVFQKRVELWGEGQSFFDYKRLNMSVTRNYDGTNVHNDFQLNTQGRPAWMAPVFSKAALSANAALVSTNNPDPSDLYATGGGLARGKMDHAEVEAWFVDAPMKELLGLKSSLNYQQVVAASAEEPGTIHLKSAFSYLKDMAVDGLVVNDENGLNIQVKGDVVTIPMQSIGCKLNGVDIRIASTKDGILKDNVITFPANAITMDAGNGLQVVNSHAQFEITLAEKKTDVSIFYDKYNTETSNFFMRGDRLCLHQKISLNKEGTTTEDIVRGVLVPYSQGDDALARLLQDETYGALQDKDGYIDIPAPTEGSYFALCYAVCRNDVVISTRKVTIIYPEVSINLDEGLDAEKQNWNINTYFSPHLDQAYVAVVTEDMDNAAIQQQFEQGKLKYLYEATVNKNNASQNMQIPVPAEHGIYRLVGIGVRDGKVVNIGHAQDYYWNYETNNYELFDSKGQTYELPRIYDLYITYLNLTDTEAGKTVRFSLSADPDIAYTKVILMEVDELASYSSIYQAVANAQYTTTCPASGEYSITLPTMTPFKPYVLLAVAYEKDGSYAKSSRSTTLQTYGDWTTLGQATYTEDMVTSFYATGNPSYNVEIQENNQIPGFYRLKNPYGAAYPHNEPGDWDDSKDYYMYIHAENPDQVYFNTFHSGMNWGYGEFVFSSRAGRNIEGGVAVPEEYYGKLQDGIITFPVRSLLISMTEYNEGGMYFANNNGAFRIVLPGYNQPANAQRHEVKTATTEQKAMTTEAKAMTTNTPTKKFPLLEPLTQPANIKLK